MKKVPNEREWGKWSGDLDQSAAHAAFFGKTIEEVEQVFATNPIEGADNLRFMPPVPFQYYIHAFKNFLLSGASKGHADAASSYLRLLQDKLHSDPTAVVPVMPSLLPSVDAVAERQAFYEAPDSIYADFTKIRDELRRSYQMRVRREPQVRPNRSPKETGSGKKSGK